MASPTKTHARRTVVGREARKTKRSQPAEEGMARRILAIDIGGTNVKMLASGEHEPLKIRGVRGLPYGGLASLRSHGARPTVGPGQVRHRAGRLPMSLFPTILGPVRMTYMCPLIGPAGTPLEAKPIVCAEPRVT